MALTRSLREADLNSKCMWYRLECRMRTKKYKSTEEIFRNNLYQTHRPDLAEKCDRLISFFFFFFWLFDFHVA